MTTAERQELYPNLRPFTSENNPGAGRPKGSKNFATLIRDMVENPKYRVRLKDGTVVKHPGAKIVHGMAVKAMEGDVQAATWLSKYGYGEKQDITSNGESIGVNAPVSMELAAGFAKYLLEQTRAPIIEGEVVDNTTLTDTVPHENKD